MWQRGPPTALFSIVSECSTQARLEAARSHVKTLDRFNPTDPDLRIDLGATMHIISDPSAQAALWTRARSMFARAIEAIGEPSTIAAKAALTRQTKYDIAGWLGRLESIVRKLLLALAAALFDEARQSGKAGARGLRPRHAPEVQAHASQARPEAARSDFNLAAPETWPARFALAPPRDPHAVPESRAPRIRALWGPTPAPLPPAPVRAESRVTEPALRFALRFEALKRVLADPIPYATRLARVMRRLVRRYPSAADRYAIAPARPCVSDEGDPRLIIDAITAAMFGAPALVADTS